MDVLNDILDHLNDSVIIINTRGKVVLFNNEAARIQKSISETPIAIGADFSGLAGDAHKQTVAAVIKTLKKQKKPLQYAAEFQTSYECNVFLELNFVPVLGKKRELRYISIITQDVTSRKIFEKRSKTAEADVRTLLDHAQAFILSVDSRGYIVDWNNHCASTTGFSKNEILSQKLSDTLISHKDRVVFNDMITRVMENQPVINCELPVRTKEGGEVIILMSATPRTNGNREVVGATLVGQDITELIAYRRSMEELVKKKTAALQKILNKEKEAVEMKNRFVSIASHELRTPLSSIDFAASFIKRNASTIGSKKLNEKVEVIEKHVSYMSHLLEDVLNFNKNEKGRIKIIPSSFGLDDFIRSAVAEVMCSTKHSHHICVSANSLGELFTDEKLLRNVLINLLTNAVKFSPGKEEISLNVLDEEACVTLEVRDQGMGIPEEEIDMIFEPFLRGRAANAIEGTGLGLSIVKKAVELLNGAIQVESTWGKGSVFKVTIPRQMVLT